MAAMRRAAVRLAVGVTIFASGLGVAACSSRDTKESPSDTGRVTSLDDGVVLTLYDETTAGLTVTLTGTLSFPETTGP